MLKDKSFPPSIVYFCELIITINIYCFLSKHEYIIMENIAYFCERIIYLYNTFGLFDVLKIRLWKAAKFIIYLNENKYLLKVRFRWSRINDVHYRKYFLRVRYVLTKKPIGYGRRASELFPKVFAICLTSRHDLSITREHPLKVVTVVGIRDEFINFWKIASSAIRFIDSILAFLFHRTRNS